MDALTAAALLVLAALRATEAGILKAGRPSDSAGSGTRPADRKAISGLLLGTAAVTSAMAGAATLSSGDVSLSDLAPCLLALVAAVAPIAASVVKEPECLGVLTVSLAEGDADPLRTIADRLTAEDPRLATALRRFDVDGRRAASTRRRYLPWIGVTMSALVLALVLHISAGLVFAAALLSAMPAAFWTMARRARPVARQRPFTGTRRFGEGGG